MTGFRWVLPLQGVPAVVVDTADDSAAESLLSHLETPLKINAEDTLERDGSFYLVIADAQRRRTFMENGQTSPPPYTFPYAPRPRVTHTRCMHPVTPLERRG